MHCVHANPFPESGILALWHLAESQAYLLGTFRCHCATLLKEGVSFMVIKVLIFCI